MLGLPNRSYACSIKYGSNQINLPQYARENVEVRKMGQGTTVITNDSKKKIDNTYTYNTPDSVTES
jgi:hypothetical protein